MRTILALGLLFAALRTSSCAHGLPPWYRAGDAVTVVRTATVDGFAYAVVHDGSKRQHATYCVAVGAHIGGRIVTAIRPDGVVLSGGRVLRSEATPSETAVAATAPRP